MVNEGFTPDTVVAAVLQDQQVRQIAYDLKADPTDQTRLFRGRRVGSDALCVLKIDLGDLEAEWMPAISARVSDVVARVLGHGRLAELDRRWLLLEDLPFRARSDNANDAVGVMSAAARFQRVAAELSLQTYPVDAEFFSTYARQAIEAGCPGPASDVLSRIDDHDRWLRSLNGHVKTHGDLHFWNAVAAAPDGPWRLIDPIPRTAHWAWDAAYAQLTSGVEATPDLITLLAAERQRISLPAPGLDQIDRLHTVLLGLSSLLWWAIQPARRTETWWCHQVEHNIAALAHNDI